MRKFLAVSLVALMSFAATIVPDSYDKLFCKANGTTTTFVDSSTANPKTITANGNATQLSLPTAFSGKRTAGFFNGTTDYVVVPSSADFAFGTGAFEVEFYFNILVADNGTYQEIIDKRTLNNSTSGFFIYSYGGKLGLGKDSLNRIDGTTSILKNTWYKVKVVGNGGPNGSRTIKMYLNDVQEGGTFTQDYNLTDQTLKLGAAHETSNQLFGGWLKNLTIVKGSTTVLDMRFDSPATSPLAPAIALDGTGDYFDLDNSADFAPGTGTFTVEGFFNTGVAATAQTIYDTRTATANTTGFLINLASSKLCFTTATTARITGGTTLIANRWYHYAVVGNGGADGARTVTLYLNGQVEGSVYTNNYNFTDQTLRIGSIKAAAGTAFLGYLREIRTSNNSRYASAFTPSQTGFTVDANTKLYIKGDEANGAVTFIDSETSPKTVITAGDTKIKYGETYLSCVFKDETGKFPYPVGSAKVDFFSAFGSGVGYFDGTNSAATTPNSDDFNFTNSDFSLETFMRIDAKSSPTAVRGFACKTATNGNTGWDWFWHTDGKVYFAWNLANTGTYLGMSLASVPAKTWCHLAVVRNGNNLYMFLNGILSATKDVTGVSITTNMHQLNVGYGQNWNGANVFTGDGWFNGLLDNIRISKGIARYVATFNPPEDFVRTGSARKKASSWWNFF